MTSPALGSLAARVLKQLQQDAPKPHSADDLSSLVSVPAAEVQQALQELHAAQLVSPQAATGYGGSATLWSLNP